MNRLAADQPFTFLFAAREIASATLGLQLRGSPDLSGAFGQWFPLPIFLLALGAITWIVGGWLAPWRHRVRQEALEREPVERIVREWGVDTLAPFALRKGQVVLLCRRPPGLRSSPTGSSAALRSSPVTRSATRARSGRCWPASSTMPIAAIGVLAVLAASDRWLDLYRLHGLNVLYHGDEAVVDTVDFALEGRAIRKVRQSVTRLEKSGYTARCCRPSQVGPELRHALESISDSWRGGQPERGFAMAFDALFGLDDANALFIVGDDEAGNPRGFLHFAIAHAGFALSLSSMPRLRAETPNGFNEWLICETVAWARSHGYRHVSLNFSPFAALLGATTELRMGQELQRRALLTLKGHFQLDNLLAFNRQVPSPLGAPLHRLRTSARSPAGRNRRARRRGLPPISEWSSMRLVLGLLLALGSAIALNWGFFAQHGAASALPPLPPAYRSARCGLFASRRWLAGFLVGIAGWALYVAALAFAQLSLVQATSSASACSLCSSTSARETTGSAGPDSRDGRDRGSGAAVACGAHVSTGPVSSMVVLLWLLAAVLVAAVVVVSMRLGVPHAVALGVGAGILYATGDIATKAAVASTQFLLVACRYSPPTASLSSAFSSAFSVAARSSQSGWRRSLPTLFRSGPGRPSSMSACPAVCSVTAGSAPLSSSPWGRRSSRVDGFRPLRRSRHGHSRRPGSRHAAARRTGGRCPPRQRRESATGSMSARPVRRGNTHWGCGRHEAPAEPADSLPGTAVVVPDVELVVGRMEPGCKPFPQRRDLLGEVGPIVRLARSEVEDRCTGGFVARKYPLQDSITE